MSAKTAITNCDAAPIQGALSNSLRKFLKRNRWIGADNFFEKSDVRSVIDKVEKTAVANKINVQTKRRNLSDYTAASTIVHCFDGWNFLARACDSFISGDSSTAFHLSYYAQLRATMSIMASNGISIFNRKHFYFDLTSGDIDFITKDTTHVVSSNLLTAWSNFQPALKRTLNIIQVRNFTLYEWLNHSPFNGSPQFASALLHTWMKQWSLDVTLEKDKELREQNSYRPRFESANIPSRQAVEHLIEIWRALEPSADFAYNLMDLHFLRLTLEAAFRANTSKKPFGLDYNQFVNTTLLNLNLQGDVPLRNFLTHLASPSDHIIFSSARRLQKTNQGTLRFFDDSLASICRAVIWLRIATGFTKSFVDTSGITKTELDSWWLGLNEKLGLTSDSNKIPSTDLFSDVENAINSIDLNSPILTNRFTLFQTYGSELSVLSQFQRAAFWGLAL